MKNLFLIEDQNSGQKVILIEFENSKKVFMSCIPSEGFYIYDNVKKIESWIKERSIKSSEITLEIRLKLLNLEKETNCQKIQDNLSRIWDMGFKQNLV